MVILNEITDSLKIKLSNPTSSNPLEVYICCSKNNSSGSKFSKYPKVIASGTNTLIAPPLVDENIVCSYLTVFNADVNSSEIRIFSDDGVNTITHFKGVLNSGEKAEFSSEYGWKVISNAGSIKHSISQGSSPVTSNKQIIILSSDVINNNAVANTIQPVTGLSFSVLANKVYWFKFTIDYTAQVNTTGSRWSITGPSFSRLSYYSEYSLAATTKTFNEGLSAYNLPAAANTGTPTTVGATSIVEGFVTPTVNGTIQLVFASEVSSSAIVAKVGSMCEYLQLT
jgi:hypothetical protein